MGLIRQVFESAWETAAKWYSDKHHPADVADPVADVQNRYEGAYQFWGQRGYIPAGIQDARFDADASTRLELVRRSRYWERNSAILQRLIDVFEQFTVGPDGIKLVPSSEDEPYNELASDWWAGWVRCPSLDTKQPLGVMQSLMARSWFVDGEIFIYKTWSKETGKPAIQLIEAHRVATPAMYRDREGQDIIDGVEINASGTPIAYHVRQADFVAGSGYQGGIPGLGSGQPQSQNFVRVPAASMIHLFEPVRPGMQRGLPMAYAVMNDAQDLHELQHLEMRAARDAASITNVVTNKTGEANNQQYSKRNKWSITSADANGNPTTKNIPVFYEVTMGGQTVYQVVGEKFEQFKSERPNVATTDYWDYLTNKVCIGIGIPKMLVVPYRMQGTAVRADLETAAAYFRSRSMIIGHAMTEIYFWVMGWATKFDREMIGAPKDWSKVTVRPPRSVNVDVGRNSSALIAEMSAGIRTRQDAIAELGGDWRQVLRQRAKEAAYVNRLVKEFAKDGVTIDQIAQLSEKPAQATPPPAAPSNPVARFPALVVKSGNNGHSNGHARINLYEEAID